MKKLVTGLFLGATIAVAAQTQDSLKTIPAPDTLVMDTLGELSLNVAEQLTLPLDTMLSLDSILATIDSIPKLSDAEYTERLLAIKSDIGLDYNPTVKRYIELYTVRKRKHLANLLGRGIYYLPLFEESLVKHELPLELKYLPVIESAMNPHAVSRMGATGLWQFMYRTGKLYKLRVDSYVDERKDPLFATDAAARYLKYLHATYGDWKVAIAAYNCGPGNVNKAIRRAGGGKKTFWELQPYLPRETRNYVPGFIGAVYAMEYADKHFVEPITNDLFYVYTDTVRIHHQMSLNLLAEHLEVPKNDLKFFNPSLKQGIIPKRSMGYPVRIPGHKLNDFFKTEDSLMAMAKTVVPKPAPAVAASGVDVVPDLSKYAKLTYTVKAGDNMGFISDWYDCSVTSLKRWNGTNSTRIRIGQQLKVYVPKSAVTKYKEVNTIAFHQRKNPTNSPINRPAIVKGSEKGDWKNYTIKSGDTLWEIARRHPGNTVESIKKLNGMRGSALKPGMQIKVTI